MNFLDKNGIYWDNSAKLILSLQDSDGQFAPYPGGGGCYDYDAIYFLTSEYNKLDLKPNFVFYRTINSIIKSINDDRLGRKYLYKTTNNTKYIENI